MAKAGTIDIYLNAFLGGFSGGLAKAQKQLVGFTKGFADINGAFQTFSGTLSQVGALVTYLADELKRLDEVGDLAARFDITADAVQRLRRTFELSGADAEMLSRSLGRLSINLGDAATGKGGAVVALHRLGLNAKELQGLSLDASFEKIVRAIGKLPTPTDRAATATDLFGKSAVELMEVFTRQGVFEQAAKEVRMYGAALDDARMSQVGLASEAKEQWEMSKRGFWDEVTLSSAGFMRDFYEGGAFALSAFRNASPSQRFGQTMNPLVGWEMIQQEVARQNQARFDPNRLSPPPVNTLAPQEVWDQVARKMYMEDMMAAGRGREINGLSMPYWMDWNPSGVPGGMKGAARGGDGLSLIDVWRDITSITSQIEGRTPGVVQGGGVGALEFGTAAAFSAIQQSRRDDEGRRVQKQQLDEAKKQTKLQERLIQSTILVQTLDLQG